MSADMSGFENVIGGKLKLKGKALDVKNKKKKRKQSEYDYSSYIPRNNQLSGEGTGLIFNTDNSKDGTSKYGNHLTSAEMKYIEQFEKINMRRLAKEATKSHRDRIQEFNQHLANLSEHYDIPKVGPG